MLKKRFTRVQVKMWPSVDDAENSRRGKCTEALLRVMPLINSRSSSNSMKNVGSTSHDFKANFLSVLQCLAIQELKPGFPEFAARLRVSTALFKVFSWRRYQQCFGLCESCGNMTFSVTRTSPCRPCTLCSGTLFGPCGAQSLDPKLHPPFEKVSCYRTVGFFYRSRRVHLLRILTRRMSILRNIP